MKKKTWKIIVRHLVLALLAIIWLIPIVWLVVTSLSTTKGVSYQHFFPEHWTLANYHQLFFKTDTAANFPASQIRRSEFFAEATSDSVGLVSVQ